ncbi:efflux RND transporter periplasmic adaptor subunit [Clostridium neonatale]|uniref:efflux RND transporter periplasmic adaptor subunit n=1 Tax=Clostridium neonatale TaxID=137838 RepID=UPI001DEEDF2A|nr:biotin/lipoyl-binding protein [Clostridium neonatale]CAG9709441.1 HlyD family secretion protein [Clostridium neonatale]
MNRKFILLICSVAVMSLVLSGCQKSSDTNEIKNVKTVETMVLSPSKYDVTLNYQGAIRASETRNYFFRSSGKVSKVYVKEGQHVKEGDILASLDTTQLNFSADSMQSSLAISENSLEKTISSYDTNIKNAEDNIETLKQSIAASQSNLDVLKSTLEANEVLYEAGAIAKMDIDNQRAQYESSEANFYSLISQFETAKNNLEKLKKDKINDIATAQENVNLSKNNMEQAMQNITDATLTAEADGYIGTIDISEGDSVTANSTVITAQSNKSMVSIGVSADDYNKLSSVKQIIINGSIIGEIDSISGSLDQATNTYTVEIAFNSDTAVIGELVNVDIVLDRDQGVFVPMESIININGVNYVYKINEDNTVSRVEVKIKEINDGKMLVSNLSNEKIVTSGVKALNDNDVVSEINQIGSLSQNGGLYD